MTGNYSAFFFCSSPLPPFSSSTFFKSKTIKVCLGTFVIKEKEEDHKSPAMTQWIASNDKDDSCHRYCSRRRRRRQQQFLSISLCRARASIDSIMSHTHAKRKSRCASVCKWWIEGGGGLQLSSTVSSSSSSMMTTTPTSEEEKQNICPSLSRLLKTPSHVREKKSKKKEEGEQLGIVRYNTSAVYFLFSLLASQKQQQPPSHLLLPLFSHTHTVTSSSSWGETQPFVQLLSLLYKFQ